MTLDRLVANWLNPTEIGTVAAAEKEVHTKQMIAWQQRKQNKYSHFAITQLLQQDVRKHYAIGQNSFT